ncbi:hypothetical protein C0Q70_03092 [Pomacea canaliculata]|uniref:Sema domain-containing protein n=1 Tax=Pomacea canaliculata TaxID=400727 RepID=A0A2T7PRR7_POMCA|nr:hypothetical protein C0Q70_03092 [Pomacea canaliculata]
MFQALWNDCVLSELLSQTSNFQHNGLVGYTQLVLDESRDQVLVGGKDILFRLSLDNLSELEVADWSSNSNTTGKCLSTGQPEESCHNFLRVLLLHRGNRVLACGTNSFDPLCTWRTAEKLSDVTEEFSGRAICPYDPRHNTTALMTDNGDLYAATPNFVSTYEFGNFVYFFFRETAVEYINCGNFLIQTDRGGAIFLEGKWTSFHKARLNCSLPGDFPFYFDELQSTFYSYEEKKVYAIFTTPPNSIAGSAVCVYNMTSFEEAFNGPFKHQGIGDVSVDEARQRFVRDRKCNSDTGGNKRSSEKSTNHLVMGMKYQLMDQAVQPATISPLVVREQERWTHIVVDHVESKTHPLEVFFLATDDGKIQKMVRLPGKSVTCLLEEIKIVPNGRPRPVKAMKLSSLKGAIYLSTDGNVLKVPVQRCHNFSDRRTCLAARDPYCGWDTLRQKCTLPPEDNPRAEYWEQDITDCPNTEYPQDGGWSRWTPWSKCQNVGGDSMMEQCLCRSRSCDNPQPINGGSPCIGASMEFMVSGQSGRSGQPAHKLAGFAFRIRKRQCGNPPPKYGGRMCAGQDTEKQYCSGSPECSLPPVDGKWSLWSGWSACTKECNGGIQTRRRSCNPAGTESLGRAVRGQQARVAHVQHAGLRGISPWTEWIQTNRTTGGYFEQRFRFTCRASVPKRKLIKTSFAKSQARFCHNNGHGCQTSGELRNSITSIDAFTSVDRVLRKFCRYKRKLFQKYCNCRTLGVFLVCQKCGYG